MVNLETVYFIETLNELARKTTFGFADWHESYGKAGDFKGIMYDSKEENRVVLNYLSDEQHHDIISYYDSHDEYTINVVPSDEESDFYVEVFCPEGNGMFIVEDGKWYSV